MIQEYLFIGKETRDAVEKYEPENVDIEIFDINNTDCWCATYSFRGENETGAKTLSKINEHIISNFHPTILANGCSAYYNKKLFPYINEFERKLRKLLYLKSALSKNPKDGETIKDLESKDLGEIFTLLFTDVNFVQVTKKTVNDKTWQFTKKEILNALQELNEITVWDNLIGADSVEELRANFIDVKDYRNDVMHAHGMNTETFNTALNLFKKINSQFDEEIGQIIARKENDTQLESDQDFDVSLNDAIKTMEASKATIDWLSQVKDRDALFSVKNMGITSALDEIKLALSVPGIVETQKYITSPEFLSLQKQFEGIAKIQTDLSPALIELQKTLSTIKTHNVVIPSEVLELQKNLEKVKPDPKIFETVNKLKGIIK